MFQMLIFRLLYNLTELEEQRPCGFTQLTIQGHKLPAWCQMKAKNITSYLQCFPFCPVLPCATGHRAASARWRLFLHPLPAHVIRKSPFKFPKHTFPCYKSFSASLYSFYFPLSLCFSYLDLVWTWHQRKYKDSSVCCVMRKKSGGHYSTFSSKD